MENATPNHPDDPTLGSETASATEAVSGGAGGTPRLRWYRDLLLASTVVAVVIADQITKYVVKTNLSYGESWPAEGLFRITYGTNSGTAFGLFPSQTTFLIVASLFAIGFLFYFYRAHALPSTLLRLAIGLQLGGAFGNLVDRIRAGAVVDFIDVGWWPDFNVADSSIVVGIALLLGILLLTNQGRSADPAESDPGAGAIEG